MEKFYLILIAIILSSCADEQKLSYSAQCMAGASDISADVFLIIGQSNAKSNAVFDGYQRAEGAYLLNDCGEWTAASPRLDKFSNISKQTTGGQFFGYSFGYSFADQYTSGLGREIAIVSNARGGADIDFLIDTGIEKTFERINPISGRIKAVLYHQGESDYNNPEWLDKAEELINTYRSLMGRDVPFIFGELCSGDYYRCQGYTEFNNHIYELQSRLSRIKIVSTSGLDTSTDIHFNKSQQIELGIRYFDKYLEL